MSDNKENLQENKHNKKSTYYPASQKKYGEKCLKYTVKYTLNESEIAEIVCHVISNSGMTPNKYIKVAIAEKLERDGFLDSDNDDK